MFVKDWAEWGRKGSNQVTFEKKKHFDRLVRTFSWELKELKKKVTKVCSKKSYQVRRKAAAHESKVFWKRCLIYMWRQKRRLNWALFFLLQSLVTFFFNSYSS